MRELLRAIEDYNNREEIEICPLSLRDTMLVIAAVLHLEAARIDSEDADRPRPGAKKLGDAFSKAARKALEDVSSAKAALVSPRSRN